MSVQCAEPTSSRDRCSEALYTIRSERQLMEQLEYNSLFRWFVGLEMDDAVWSATTFTKNRDRLLDGDIAAAFFEAVLIHADTADLLSDEHFIIDRTLLEARASHKSFRPHSEEPPAAGGGNPTVNFHGQRRTTGVEAPSMAARHAIRGTGSVIRNGSVPLQR